MSLSSEKEAMATLAPPYIDVAVALPVAGTFTFSVPDPLRPFAAAGKRVLVPFGTRRVTGYILGPGEAEGGYQIRHILDILDETPLFPPEMIDFFRWISRYYLHPLGEVIHGALPSGLNVYDHAVESLTDAGRQALNRSEPSPVQAAVLEALQEGPLGLKEIRRRLEREVPLSLIYTLERKGWLSRSRQLRGGQTRERTERWVAPADSPPETVNLTAARHRVYDLLIREGAMPLRRLRKRDASASRLVPPLVESGHLVQFEKRVYRDPFGDLIRPDQPPTLTRGQHRVVSAVTAAMERGFSTHLLAGVTGSGKTEVYLHLAHVAVRQGRGVLVLVPEIALTSQMERRFRARFGEGVAVLHSGLSGGERYDQWRRILEGGARIVIGARSAVFAPLRDPGLIVVDEEHDPSYKQERDLLYNGRDMAVVRAQLSGCVALLGSATPSIQSYHNVVSGRFTEHPLNRRISDRPLPEVEIVDLRRIPDRYGARRFFTPVLQRAMKETLERGEQTLIFLNRRGFATYPVCGGCGEAVRCKHCDITLTLHQAANAYKCHYCGFTRPSAAGCPVCGSAAIRLLGFGTEKVEKAVQTLFPDARTARMDRDTTARKGSVLRILKELRNGAIDILVGTQMVTKGHDFPNITLVGIVCADLSLSFPDFRAGERTFQLLAQVAGRAGRGEIPGRVILQTYNPAHFSITTARQQDFRAFYRREIDFRKTLAYPPFSRLIQIRISGKDPGKTRNSAERLGELCRTLLSEDSASRSSVSVMGPIEGAPHRVAETYRWQMLLKGSTAVALLRFVQTLRRREPALFGGGGAVRLVIDVDPVNML
jgi:primosomal protein N' (replication factor Y)